MLLLLCKVAVIQNWLFYGSNFVSPTHLKKKRLGIFLTPPLVRLSVTLSLSKPLGGILPNLLHHFSWYGCVRAALFFCASVRPFICHTISSLTAGRNLTKLATSLPLMVRVCESNITFPCVCQSVRLSSVNLSVMLSPPKLLGEIQPNFLHHFPSW